MSQITAVSSSSDALIWADWVCDYIPGISTITNFATIFFQTYIADCCSDSIKENRFISHLNDKSALRCFVLLVPILGQIIIAIYDVVKYFKDKRENEYWEAYWEKKTQDFQAISLDLDVTQLPENPSERAAIIEAASQQRKKESIPKMIAALDMQNQQMRVNVDKLRALITNPYEPLELQYAFGLLRKTVTASQREKVDVFWAQLRLHQSMQELQTSFIKIADVDQNEEIRQRNQLFSQLKAELIELRRNYYRDCIRMLDRKVLLQEAKKFYLQSFGINQGNIQASIQSTTLEQMVPKLRESCVDKSDYQIVEIQEILLQIEALE